MPIRMHRGLRRKGNRIRLEHAMSRGKELIGALKRVPFPLEQMRRFCRIIIEHKPIYNNVTTVTTRCINDITRD